MIYASKIVAAQKPGLMIITTPQLKKCAAAKRHIMTLNKYIPIVKPKPLLNMQSISSKRASTVSVCNRKCDPQLCAWDHDNVGDD